VARYQCRVILCPVRHPIAGLGNVVTVFSVVFERHTERIQGGDGLRDVCRHPADRNQERVHATQSPPVKLASPERII
jgi:hypothetical protein